MPRRAITANYMLIMRGTDESMATMSQAPFEQMPKTVGRHNEELIRAGVLVAAEGPGRAGTGEWWSTSAVRARW